MSVIAQTFLTFLLCNFRSIELEMSEKGGTFYFLLEVDFLRPTLCSP